MLDFIEGEIAFKYSDGIAVKCSGMGIKILVPLNLITETKIGDKIFLFTKVVFPQEGTPTVYGFKTQNERELFEILTKVPKIGSRTALNILSHFTIEELEEIVTRKDAKTLSLVPGLGKKLSERLIFELSEKFKREEKEETAEIIDLLENLGYPRREVIKVVKEIDTENKTVEEIIKEATSLLSGGKFGK
ncbi:Holliday junction branch migration protein RuvA [Desulfurobacterium atlanticum]|uniref:Holliday junction branch migration complex subunit RuvA n=1 Tax=Desulfurobacterium atlanticum TaxID=240169 RepID=A0A238XUG5_9BACT|nr:Holliday junction branch migration protein RuvA [Desulfurobacterium atlanticum]SNR62696.1 Holliday junction DNA helicase subunit RuvA [Desulfurobacterium atlanticum]